MLKHYPNEVTIEGTIRAASEDAELPAAIRAVLARAGSEHLMAGSTPARPKYRVSQSSEPDAYWVEVSVPYHDGRPMRQWGEVSVWDGRSVNGRATDQANGV